MSNSRTAHHVVSSFPQPSKCQYFHSLNELRDAMDTLPLLRIPRVGLDPGHTVVVCHAADLEEAIAFYHQEYTRLPVFYVLDREKDNTKHLTGVVIRNFADLTPDMEIQLYCQQALAPNRCKFRQLSICLADMGITKYYIEEWCIKKMYGRKNCAIFSDKDWDTILNFTNALYDMESQHTYMAACLSRLKGEPGYIPVASYSQYFHPHIKFTQADILCEGGILNGNTTLEFCEAMQGGTIYAFEPVAECCEKLREVFAPYDNIHLIEQALWEKTGKILLEKMRFGASAYTFPGTAETANCPCISIDEFFTSHPAPTAIKLDVEGAEPYVLQGAKETIARYLPKLMLSIYHVRMGKDYINVPQFLIEKNFPYKLFCGHHRSWFSETIVYAYSDER